MKVLTIGLAGVLALSCAACGQGAATTQAPAAADATTTSTPASATPAEAPALTPAPRGRDGEFGKTPPTGGAAAPVEAAPDPEPEAPAVDDPAGEEKP